MACIISVGGGKLITTYTNMFVRMKHNLFFLSVVLIITTACTLKKKKIFSAEDLSMVIVNNKDTFVFSYDSEYLSIRDSANTKILSSKGGLLYKLNQFRVYGNVFIRIDNFNTNPGLYTLSYPQFGGTFRDENLRTYIATNATKAVELNLQDISIVNNTIQRAKLELRGYLFNEADFKDSIYIKVIIKKQN